MRWYVYKEVGSVGLILEADSIRDVVIHLQKYGHVSGLQWGDVLIAEKMNSHNPYVTSASYRFTHNRPGAHGQWFVGVWSNKCCKMYPRHTVEQFGESWIGVCRHGIPMIYDEEA